MNEENGNNGNIRNGDYDSMEDDLRNILEALRNQALSLERLANKVRLLEKTLSKDLAEIRQRLDDVEKELANR